MTTDRQQTAYRVRVEAAEAARARPHPEHLANGDEQRFSSANYAMCFTKGLEHDPTTGLVARAGDFEAFRAAIDAGVIDPFTANVPGVMDPGRPWEAPTAGVVYDLEGPDAQAVTMAPAPPLGSDELAYEMAEVYWLAVLRDCPLNFLDTFRDGPQANAHGPENCFMLVADAVRELNRMDYVPDGSQGRPRIVDEDNEVSRQTVFRGSSPGVEVGPYLSQFMIAGNTDQLGTSTPIDGRITYGALQIDQRVPVAVEGQDYMTSFPDWLVVQNGGDTRDNATLFDATRPRRFICTPRDLATYVHDDALYEAYLNACLVLLGMGTPFDPSFGALSGRGLYAQNTGPTPTPGFPRKAGGFALYGGPHILTLVTEVATRALKAVRFQKFNNHIRLRPEALAARIERATDIESTFPATAPLFTDLAAAVQPVTDVIQASTGTRLLPMAFQEGSPMHPAYGAGHATVAGACTTILKAYFDTGAVFVRRDLGGGEFVDLFDTYDPATDQALHYRVNQDGSALEAFVGGDFFLTLEGELNKLAANISIGRNMAGVHYFSDYYDSLRMGEEIAIGMLEEQALCYPTDRFTLSVPTYDGEVVRVGAR